MRFLRAGAAAILALVTVAGAASAQAPDGHWRTLATTHFRVHFTSELEGEARRAAVIAERAYKALATELPPPRGMIHLVLSDDVDYSNGSASVAPYNRIVIYAHPPVDLSSLRNYDDWTSLVIVHELTHIFHLDRTRGVWRLAQGIFGRHSYLFPNTYAPAWLTEGLAVYYESRLTGSGRLEGSEHYMIANAAAVGRRLPNLGDLSLATSRYPGGNVAYAYGSLLLDFLSRTQGPRTIPAFVERESGSLLPIFPDIAAHAVFGTTFTHAWRQWEDSMLHTEPDAIRPLPEWRELTHAGFTAFFPRWIGDTAILYAAHNGRESSALYRVNTSGEIARLGRRNGADANALRPDGAVIFAQPDYVDPYRLRSDLWIDDHREQRQLTFGARLSQPDVRADGTIVAVQAVPGSTRLAVVSADGARVTPITQGTLDTQWTNPRWSPDGSRISAVRIAGGMSAIVVFDVQGAVQHEYDPWHAVIANPSWASDGSRIYFSSDATGASQLFVQYVEGGEAKQLSDVPTGLFYPELSPDLRTLAASLYRDDGYHLGVAPTPAAIPSRERRDRYRLRCPDCVAAGIAPIDAPGADTGRVRRYAPWSTLIPRYWTPIVSGGGGGSAYNVGAYTSAADPVGRHAYFAQATMNTDLRKLDGVIDYTYAGFGLPVLELSAQQGWDRGYVANSSGQIVANLDRRSRTYSASTLFSRPRMRSVSSLQLGGSYEISQYFTDPPEVLADLPSELRTGQNQPSMFVAGGWSNLQQPAFAISPEDGVSLSTSVQQKWLTHAPGATTRGVRGAVAAYKSLDLPGYAHWVAVVRGAAGASDRKATSLYSLGGVSGGSIELFPGYTVGDVQRTFQVRGYSPAVEAGTRIFSTTAELRIPVGQPGRGLWPIPVFLDRTSITLFSDAGRAYCPSGAAAVLCGVLPRPTAWIASAGAELNLDTGLQFDSPYRLRAGIALPTVNRSLTGADRYSFYLTLGFPF